MFGVQVFGKYVYETLISYVFNFMMIYPSFISVQLPLNFNFISDSGWGRAHKTAIQRWYKQFETKPDNLARLVTKYKNREGWTHKDVLRLAHPVPRAPAFGFILR